MLYTLLKAIHVLSIIVWVGGMVFSQYFLRPALPLLEPPQRLALMNEVLRRFFGTVFVASLLALVSGAWMLHVSARAAGFGGLPVSWWMMAMLGTVMVVIFLNIRFMWFPNMSRQVAAQDWAAAGRTLSAIRRLVGINLMLGILTLLFTMLRNMY